MPVKLEPRVSERILVQRYIQPVDLAAELPAAIEAIAEFSREVQGAFFAVIDMRAAPINLDGLIEALDLVRRKLANVPVRFVAIGTGEMVELAASAVAQRQYGSFEPAKVFATEEEALAYCLAELKEPA